MDNSGFPLAYCLLTTATAVVAHKRAASLSAFLEQVKLEYKVKPRFAHVDKDFAEISALTKVWPDAKIQICWWHLCRAVGERAANPSLKTTLYNPEAARQEYPFIDPSFRPYTPPNPKDNEEYGYSSNDDYRPSKYRKKKPTPSTQLPQSLPPQQISQLNPNALLIKIAIPASFNTSRTQPPITSANDSSDSSEDSDLGEQVGKHQFCPLDLREALISLLERHHCAHPSIPGDAAPNSTAIRWWAVEGMYRFCEHNNLCELWVYMWCNWYRPERWYLWARSMGPEIPRLKTTMICESQ